jgi:hypothetical protein
LILAAGAAYGQYSQRWGPTTELLSAGRSLESLPSEIGEWKLQGDEPISAGAIRMLECTGYLNRRYVSNQSGDSVVVAIVVGPPGPIAVHTPEICYSSRNYTVVDDRQPVRFEGSTARPHTLWNTIFESKDAYAERMSVFYGWSNGTEWVASKSPRFEFAASGQLYKLQLAGLMRESSESGGSDPCARFLKALVASGWSPGGDLE